MIRASALILALCTISCDSNHSLTEREIFQQKFSAFKILSDNHDYLHIMMGEHEGNRQEAFANFSASIINEDNPELTPVHAALKRIENVNNDSLLVRRLDALVDYYQSGLSIQLEAMFKSYGYYGLFDNNSAISIYDSLATGGD